MTAVRRSCRTKATRATTAPRAEARVSVDSQPCWTPLVEDVAGRARSRRCSATAPGRSSRSWVRSSGRSAGTPSRTPIQAIRAIGALTSSSHSQRDVRQRGAAEQRAEDEAGHADDDHHGHGPHAQGLVVEEPEDQRVGDRRHGRGRDAQRARSAMSSPEVVTATTARLMTAEDGEPHEEHPAPSEPVRGEPAVSSRPAEGQRVRAGDPLQGGGAAAEVAADGRQRDGQQGVVDHLDEEGEAQGGQRDPGGPDRGVGARRGAALSVVVMAPPLVSNDVRLSNVVR